AQPFLPLLEPADPVEGVSDDQQRPRVADHLQRGGDRSALARIVCGASHGSKVTPRQGFGKRVDNLNGLGQSCLATDTRRTPSRRIRIPRLGREISVFRPSFAQDIAGPMTQTLAEALTLTADSAGGLIARLGGGFSNAPQAAPQERG